MNMGKLEALRWALFIPASISGFYLAPIAMMFAQTFVDSLCPEQYVYVGDVEYCIYPTWVNTILTAVGGALAAFLVVFMGSITAPGYSRLVPYVLFSGGAIIASYMIAGMGKSTVEYLVLGLSTFGTGILTATLLSKRCGG